MKFVVEIPLHEVATCTQDDIVAVLRYVADQVSARPKEDLIPFALDPNTVNDLLYISYGVQA